MSAPMSVAKGVGVMLLWAAALVLVLVVTYELFLFAVHGFSLDYRSIDRCLDSGGSWNYAEHMCATP